MSRPRSLNDRVEPRFGTGRGGADLRVTAEDRPTGFFRSRARDDDDAGEARRRKPKDRRTPKEPRRPKRRRSLFGRLMMMGLTLGLWALIAVGCVIGYYALKLPPTHELAVPKRPPNIAILAANGQEFANRGDTGGAEVKLKSLPKYVPQALIAIEDRRFYSHFGIDVIGLGRALYTNLSRSGMHQGGSSLTQQLAKNLFLTPERSMGRKIQEALLALWLERNYTKDEILELYLNRVYFGAGAYGIEAAARRFYGKPATALTLHEAATIAGLVKAPSRLAPTRDREAADERAQLVLAAMARDSYITEAQAKTIAAEGPRKLSTASASSSNYVADWVMDLIDDYVGKVESDIVVSTTLDLGVQAAADRALNDELSRQGGKFGVQQGAVVVLDMQGAVKGLVGGRSYADSQFNRAVNGRRQPGSSFKPFVYLSALEAGLTPDTVREDAPVQIKGWKPENYSRDYRGPVTLTQALAMSLNTVAVRLGQEVGPKQVARTAQRLGILSKLDPNPSLALGTSEVTPLELTSAYVPFANGGTGVIAHVITKITTTSGKVLYARAPAGPGEVIKPAQVAMMNAMMNETLTTGTARKAQAGGWPAAGKTGTSQDFRDAWFVGYTGRYVTGVWVGNDDGTPTKKASGSGLPVDIWSKVMADALKGQKVVDLPGNWRALAGAVGNRGGGEALDEPVRLDTNGMAQLIERTAAPKRQQPAGDDNPGALIKANKPGQGLIERLFR